MRTGWIRETIAVLSLCGAVVMAPVGMRAQGAQSGPHLVPSPDGKKLPSPAADATVSLGGKMLKINYNSPSVRGRTIFGGQVPYGEVWRTGANPATSFTTAASLRIGNLRVPAGSYTLYSLPSERDAWQLIVNRQTGQWGTEYSQGKDLGRTPMTGNALAAPQEMMSLSFENTHGTTTQLHMKWDKVDEYVTVTAE